MGRASVVVGLPPPHHTRPPRCRRGTVLFPAPKAVPDCLLARSPLFMGGLAWEAISVTSALILSELPFNLEIDVVLLLLVELSC